MSLDTTEITAEVLDEAGVNASIPHLGLMIRDLKIELEAATKEKTRIQKLYDHLTINIVPERMEDEGIESLKIIDVGRLQTKADIRCSCPAGNKEKLQDWLENQGHEALVASVVNASTLKAFVAEQIKQGGDYPKDLLKIEPYSRATVVKA